MTFPGDRPRLLLILLSLCVAWPALAVDLAWPDGAERVMAEAGASTGFDIATGPHDGATLAIVTVQGELSEEVWQVPGDAGDPVRMVALIRDQLIAQGYDIGFSCADRGCGGFDFRYALPIAEEPIMHVDLGQFQYLTATRGGATTMEHLVLTLSQGGGLGYAHLARITPPGRPVARPVTPAPQAAGADQGVIAQMIATGSAVLADVTFGTGASSLSDDRVESLAALAAYLADNPAQRVVLVGHTDTEGTLEANITLSRARAAAVRRHLIDIHGTNPDQVAADGIGYLSPRASNADPQGRETNRRVEAVLITN